jgi:hypothetical protein
MIRGAIPAFGEVDPDEQVLACYEPAYRIVLCFLGSIR